MLTPQAQKESVVNFSGIHRLCECKIVKIVMLARDIYKFLLHKSGAYTKYVPANVCSCMCVSLFARHCVCGCAWLKSMTVLLLW